MNNLTQYFPFLLTLSPLVLFYQQSKNFFLKVFRLVWKQRVIPFEFANAYYMSLRKESILINFDDYSLQKEYYYSLTHKKYLPILFKLFNFEIFLYKKFIPILVFPMAGDCLKIQYLKFTFNFEEFC